MFNKQRSASLLAAVVLLSGCSTGSMRLAPKSVSGLPSAIARFEQTRGLACSELPVLYDISRLKAGSSVKMKLAYDQSGRPSDVTMTLRETKGAGAEKKYIMDVISGRTRYAIEGSSSAFDRIICSDDSKIESYYLKRDNSTWVLVQSAAGGVLGIAIELIERACEPQEGRELSSMKDTKVETKIIDFKLVSEETLTVSGRLIPCRVYAVRSISRESVKPLEHAASSTAIIEETKKVWISDEVPFGLVKSEGEKTLNMEVPGMGLLSMGQGMRESCEVEEFHY